MEVCSWKCQALWAGTGSVLESPQKMFPHWFPEDYWEIFCGIGNYIVVFIEHLHITLVRLELVVVILEIIWYGFIFILFSVICRSSLFSLQIKKVLKQLSLLYLWCLLHPNKNSEDVLRSRAAFWLNWWEFQHGSYGVRLRPSSALWWQADYLTSLSICVSMFTGLARFLWVFCKMLLKHSNEPFGQPI